MVSVVGPKTLREHTRGECLKSFVVNFLISAGLAYAIFSKHDSIEAWGVEGYVVDLTATGFFMAVIVAAIYIVKHKISKQRWLLAAPENSVDVIADHLPLSVTLASLMIGIIGLVSAAVLLLILVPMGAYIKFTAASYAVIKGFWAGALAALVVYMAVRCGLKINNAQYQLH